MRLEKKVGASPRKFFTELDNCPPGSVTIIFNKCHILLKPATPDQVTDKKNDSYHPEQSNEQSFPSSSHLYCHFKSNN